MGTKLSTSQFEQDTTAWYETEPDENATDKDIEREEKQLLDSLTYPVLCATLNESDAKLLCAGYCRETFKVKIIPNVVCKEIKRCHSMHSIKWEISKKDQDKELIAPSFKIDFDNMTFSYFLMEINDDTNYKTIGIEPEIATINASVIACCIKLMCKELDIFYQHIHRMAGKQSPGGNEAEIANQFKFPKDDIESIDNVDKLTIIVEMELWTITKEEEIIKFRQCQDV